MSGLSIRAEGLQQHFDLGNGHTKRAVDGVTLSIGEGERVGFIGRNGAGKTTLLQMFAGILQPTGGRLSIDGKVTAIFTLGIGLREDLTGLENIYIEGELQGRSREQTRSLVDEIIEFSELGAFIHQPVRTYSTGMKARLAFSTIVHIEPEILIVDEALSVGDIRFSAKATRKMQELTRKGRILLVVSHSMAAIEDMCTRCVWLDSGAVRRDGVPTEVTHTYLDEVRKAEEAGLFARFKRELKEESILAGWRIGAAEVVGSEGIAARNLVTGSTASFVAEVQAPVGAVFSARLRLSRMDGLLVLESAPASHFVVPAVGTKAVRVDFGRLPLNYGVYKAELDILDNGAPAARRSTLFEVHNPRPPRGGRPVLAYPCAVSATPVSS